jgi:hypothetical protein
MQVETKCVFCGHKKVKETLRVEWKTPPFRESMNTHWMQYCIVEGELRFKTYCRKSDCGCFVEDVKENRLIEYNGTMGAATLIIQSIIEPQLKLLQNGKDKGKI